MPRTPIEIPPGLEHLSILDEAGTLNTDLEPDLDDDVLSEMHRVMLLSRRFDDRRLRWQRSGRIGTFAPVKGQEAAQIGAVAALEDNDWMVPSFRETRCGHLAWRPIDFSSGVGQTFQRSMSLMYLSAMGWEQMLRRPTRLASLKLATLGFVGKLVA